MALEVNSTVYAIAGTTTSAYQVGLIYRFENNDTSHAECKVYITPCLRNIKFNEKRYQHIWNVHFAVDGKHVQSYRKQTLPVITSATMTMKKNQWYQWGPTYTHTLTNDGKEHTFGVYLHCESTTPRYCPAYNTYTHTAKIATRIYTITPSTPAGLKTTFDESTRKITYSWDKPTNTNKVFLDRWLYDVDNTIIGTGQTFELSGTTTSYTEILSEDVALAKFRVTFESTTATRKVSDYKASGEIPTNCKVWIKLPNGTWKKAIPWIKLPDGTWKKANKVYVKTNDVWKQTIM